MNDLISRRDAIETIFNEPLCESGMKEKTAIAVVLAIYEKIKSLPSAQPDLNEVYAHAETEAEARYHAEIVRCKDCKWKQGAECVRFADVRPFADDFCSRAERRTDGN